MFENSHATGLYTIQCFDKSGQIKWSEEFPNVVTVVGRNLALTTFLSGSGYSVVGPFAGLITNTSFTAVSASDSMSSHAGWLESTCYSGNRGTATWGTASAAAISFASAMTFNVTSTDVLAGAFLVYGTGASNTVSSTSGVLYSCGTFGSTKSVSNGDAVALSYTASM